MFPKQAKPREFKLRHGDSTLTVKGWESSFVLGIYQSSEGHYVSAMLMPGVALADGFESVEQAHEFNILVMGHAKLFVGTSNLEEMFTRAGGREEAQKFILQLKNKATKGTSK